MDFIFKIVNLLAASFIIMLFGRLLWKFADFIGRTFKFSEAFRYLFQQLKRLMGK